MDKHVRIRNAIYIILLSAALLFVYILANRVLLLKNIDGIDQFRAYYHQEKNTVDVLVVGNSHSYCHVNPAILWEDYGISAYDLGGGEQTMSISYYYIKEALKTQRPKVLCLDVSTVSDRNSDTIARQWAINNTFGMKYNRNRIDAIRSSVSEDTLKDYILPLSSMHERYTELGMTDFTDIHDSIDFKGYRPKEGIQSFEVPAAAMSEERLPLTAHQEKYLMDIINLTKSEGIPLYIMVTPYIMEEEEQARLNTVLDIAKENNITCTDFNKLYDEIGLDFNTDFAEKSHLNRVGSTKFTAYLGNILKNDYDLADHRGDPLYDSWNAAADRSRQDYAAFYMPSISYVKDFFDLFLNGKADVGGDWLKGHFTANPDDYILFVMTGADRSLMSPDTIDSLASVGISDPVPGGKYIVDGRGLVYRTDSPIFSKGYRTKLHDILFYSRENKEENRIDTFVRTDDEEHPLSEQDTSVLIYDKALGVFVRGIRIDPAGQIEEL